MPLPWQFSDGRPAGSLMCAGEKRAPATHRVIHTLKFGNDGRNGSGGRCLLALSQHGRPPRRSQRIRSTTVAMNAIATAIAYSGERTARRGDRVRSTSPIQNAAAKELGRKRARSIASTLQHRAGRRQGLALCARADDRVHLLFVRGPFWIVARVLFAVELAVQRLRIVDQNVRRAMRPQLVSKRGRHQRARGRVDVDRVVCRPGEVEAVEGVVVDGHDVNVDDLRSYPLSVLAHRGAANDVHRSLDVIPDFVCRLVAFGSCSAGRKKKSNDPFHAIDRLTARSQRLPFQVPTFSSVPSHTNSPSSPTGRCVLQCAQNVAP